MLKAYMEKGRTEYSGFEECVVKSLKTLKFLAKTGRKQAGLGMDELWGMNLELQSSSIASLPILLKNTTY